LKINGQDKRPISNKIQRKKEGRRPDNRRGTVGMSTELINSFGTPTDAVRPAEVGK